jgi:hypothetical protein
MDKGVDVSGEAAETGEVNGNAARTGEPFRIGA